MTQEELEKMTSEDFEKLKTKNSLDLSHAMLGATAIIGMYGLSFVPNNKLRWFLLIITAVVFFYSQLKLKENENDSNDLTTS